MITNFKHETKTRKQLKARRDRLEDKVRVAVRADCVRRDGYCRLSRVDGIGPCQGESEWAHLGEWKRFKTRGMSAMDRHHTKGSLQLCTRHHRAYDDGEFDLDYGALGANGLIAVRWKAAERETRIVPVEVVA